MISRKKKNKTAKLREVEFGLIPNQIMVKECIKRDKKENIIKGKEIIDTKISCVNCLITKPTISFIFFTSFELNLKFEERQIHLHMQL